MVDCLEYAVRKENELPKIIDLIFRKIFPNSKDFEPINKHMRTAKEILREYNIESEV